ncbi:MAG: PLP-dependent aminotransferase family protein [Pseudomonadales bacterium]|nr:PLP-dependent aminotransferase family protein [Pseudomonadales bacterium]
MQLDIDPDSTSPLYRQLFERIRQSIHDGNLVPGSRLPASRELAGELAISRNTVNSAYDLLVAEGYVDARRGAGYFVARRLPDMVPRAALSEAGEARETGRGVSRRGEHLAKASRPVTDAGPAFQRGLPALDRFPFRQWQAHLDRHSRRPDFRLLRYQDEGGLHELKRALHAYLTRYRGVRADPDQIIIVTGGQAALDLIARLIVDEGDQVAIEEPGYLGARDALLAAGATLMPVPVDDEGICADLIEPGARLVYTTPSYQFPLGVTLSAARRIALLNWAADHDGYIIEDDYDSEFRFRGRPLSCLQGMDQGGRVIYMGTFSKVMFPALRLGYIVSPRHLAGSFAAALRKTGQDAPLVLQAAMADFIDSGQFASHIRRMRNLYRDRQARFVTLARQYLGHLLDVRATDAGMQLAAPFKVALDPERVRRSALAHELDVGLLSSCYLGRPVIDGLFLGYAGVPEEEVESALRRLALACEAVLEDPVRNARVRRSGPPAAGGS